MHQLETFDLPRDESFGKKHIIAICIVAVIIALVGTVIALSVVLFSQHNTICTCNAPSICIPKQLCQLPPFMDPPTICLVKPPANNDKSWTVQHNVPYLNAMWPHVELGMNSASKHRPGEMYTLVNITHTGSSIYWMVDGLYNTLPSGSQIPAHFTVWYNISFGCASVYLSRAWPVDYLAFTDDYSTERYTGNTQRCG